jgi:protein ImuB
MALWLSIFLPALPLQLAARGMAEIGADTRPLAVVEGPEQRPRIAFCNDAARAAGIAPGQKLAAAEALAHDLIAVVRHSERERDAVDELACWAYQFSPSITRAENGLLIETGASRRLFGGHARLHRRITHGLRGLGYAATFAYAVTPRAAWLLGAARAQQPDAPALTESRQGSSPHGSSVSSGTRPIPDVFDIHALPAALAPLPLSLFDWDSETVATLQALGLHHIADLLQLPRDGLTRRFGRALLDDLDRALGRVPDPQPLFAPPEQFDVKIELPTDVTDAAQLMFPAHRLLRSLEGFLRGRGAGTTALVFIAHHNPRRALPRPPTRIELRLATPERDAHRLARLFEERLMRCQLPEPAIALTLRVDQITTFAAVNASWLPPASNDAQHGADWLHLAETLHARLGSERVFQLQTVDDHRPEHAYRVTPLSIDAQSDRKREQTDLHAPRPLLILLTPQPLTHRNDTPNYGGALTLLVGPERIEAGWWDLAQSRSPGNRSVFRDYFVARNPRGQTLWVYRELTAPRAWYLHGFFA